MRNKFSLKWELLQFKDKILKFKFFIPSKLNVLWYLLLQTKSHEKTRWAFHEKTENY